MTDILNKSIVVNIWDPNGKHIARSVANVSEFLELIRPELARGYTVTIRPLMEAKLPRTFDRRKVHTQ